MPDAATSASIVSLLPDLEPIAGAALAINLAYVNLKRFRYRTVIRDYALEQLRVLGQKNNGDVTSGINISAYKRIERLAKLSNNEKKFKNVDGDAPDTLPGGFWGQIYRFVFQFHQDRWVSFFFTGTAVLALIGGVAHNIGHMTGISHWFADGYELITFYILVAGILGPILFVILGKYVVDWACHFTNDCRQEVEHFLQEVARTAALKASPQNGLGVFAT